MYTREIFGETITYLKNHLYEKTEAFILMIKFKE